MGDLQKRITRFDRPLNFRMTSTVAMAPPSTPPDGYTIQKSMTHHHHEAGHGHPARAVSPSVLRMSAAARLVAAVAIVGVLWVAVWWVMM